MLRRLADGPRAVPGGREWQVRARPRDDVLMKLPHGRRAHEGARPTWRPRSAWLWMLVFRRQHHQEIATVLSDVEATERRFTELYTEAVEQLGSDKAPVRFDGLSALERLAQDHPVHRQTIVNVVCAYLRMPFSPAAPASKPESEASEGQEEPGAKSETGTHAIGGTWQQERQLRLTAQRILAEHLFDDRPKDEQPRDPPSSRFWNNIRLDLTGATLIEFNLVNGVMAGVNFHRATFSGDAWFSAAAFSGTARFEGAAFSGEDSLHFGRSRIARPDAHHAWPTGWRLGPDGSGGCTVVREDGNGSS